MSTTLSIDTAQSPNFKQRLKDRLGAAVASFSPARTRQLFDAPQSSPSALRDKVIMAFLKRRAMSQNQTEFFERLHLDFWQGEGGSVFSENCDHRFEDLFLAKQAPEFSALKALWLDRQPKHIVEFGCNSGLLLDYLTRNLSGATSWTGIEINKEQVQKNNDSDSLDSRIEFLCADGGKWLLEQGHANTLFVSNGGVLEYFSRERLDEMLTHVRESLKPAIFFASEPIAEDHDWSRTKESIPFGEELSFSHNYTDLFESNGFEVVHQRAVEFESWKMMATIAIFG